jgi:hypothetical protein
MAALLVLPPSQRKGGAGPGSPREKPNLHRQRECAVKCSHGSVLSVSPFSTILLQYDSLAKAHGHCLCDIAHFASAQCTSNCSCRCRPLPIREILYSVSDERRDRDPDQRRPPPPRSLPLNTSRNTGQTPAVRRTKPDTHRTPCAFRLCACLAPKAQGMVSSPDYFLGPDLFLTFFR